MTNILILCNNLAKLDSLAYNIGHMKSFIAGLITIVILGLVGYYTFKVANNYLADLKPSPVASTSPTPSPSAVAQATPTPTPEPQVAGVKTTKGGEPIEKPGTVKGVTSPVTTQKVVTTTTTTERLVLTIVKTSICPISYTTEIKDIKGPLTFRYKLIDNTSFGITIWNSKGEELLQNTTYSGNSGQIKTISGVDYMKVRVESKACAGNNDNWLLLTAER